MSLEEFQLELLSTWGILFRRGKAITYQPTICDFGIMKEKDAVTRWEKKKKQRIEDAVFINIIYCAIKESDVFCPWYRQDDLSIDCCAMLYFFFCFVFERWFLCSFKPCP